MSHRWYPGRPATWLMPSVAALHIGLMGTVARAESRDESHASTSEDIDFANLSLEDLGNVKVQMVYGASKHEQRVSEAPSSVTLVTRDEIQKSGYQTLADLLNAVPGLYVRSDRNFSIVGIRGFSHPGDVNTKFQTLLDGHRLNDSVSDRAMVDLGLPLDLDLIERVEIIRGPGSSLYGDSAFFGVINIVPRKGRDLAGGEISTQAGSFDSYQGRFTYGTSLTNGIDFTLSGTLRQAQGHSQLYFQEFDTPESNHGIADHVDREKAGSLYASLAWEGLKLRAGYVERFKELPTAPYGTIFNTPLNSTRGTQLFADLSYERIFATELEVTARLGYDRGTEIGSYLYANDLDGYTKNIDDIYSQRVTLDLQARQPLFARHALTFGTQLVGNIDQDQLNFDRDPSTSYLVDRRQSLSFAFFAQDEYQILQNLILNAGVRFDHFETFGSTVNPRLALVYQATTNTTLKALYGTAFRAPSPAEMYYNDGGISQVPNPDLKPETITSFELVASQRIGAHLEATVSGFYYRIQDLIGESTLPETDPNSGDIQLDNLGQADARGAELAIQGSWRHGLRGRLSYSYTDARDALTRDRLVNSPSHLAKLNLSIPLYREKVFLTVEPLYVSRRIGLSGNSAPGFAVVNATLFSRNLMRNLEFSAGLHNLLDAQYREPGGPEHLQNFLEQDGRTFLAKFTLRF